MSPTLTHELTSEPVDIKASLSLADGALYSCQFRGNGFAVLWQGSTTPTAGAATPGFVIDDQTFVDIYIETGERTYAWSDPKKGGGYLNLSLIPEGV